MIAEFEGQEIAELKITDEVAGVEIAGLENGGLENDRMETDRLENATASRHNEHIHMKLGV